MKWTYGKQPFIREGFIPLPASIKVVRERTVKGIRPKLVRVENPLVSWARDVLEKAIQAREETRA